MAATARQELIDLFNGRGSTRIPVAPFIHVNSVRAFYKNREVDAIEKTVDVYEHFGFDIIHRNCTPGHDDVNLRGEGWEAHADTTQDERGETTTTVVRTPEGELRQVSRLNWVSEYDAEASPVEYLIKSEADLELVMAHQPPVGEMETSPIARARKAVGDRGIVAPWIQGAFNYVAVFFRPPDELMLDALTNPEFFHRTMRYFLERDKQIAAQYIDAGADVLSYAGNIASGKMVSRSFFEAFILPYEKELIDFVQSRGVPVLYHNCGCARNLLPVYRELGMKAYESLTPPPYGDTILEEALNVMRSDTVLSGNIDQIDFLMTASPEQVMERARDLMQVVGKRGAFVLAATDYFHEDTPHENIHALAEAAAWR